MSGSSSNSDSNSDGSSLEVSEYATCWDCGEPLLVIDKRFDVAEVAALLSADLTERLSHDVCVHGYTFDFAAEEKEDEVPRVTRVFPEPAEMTWEDYLDEKDRIHEEHVCHTAPAPTRVSDWVLVPPTRGDLLHKLGCQLRGLLRGLQLRGLAGTTEAGALDECLAILAKLSRDPSAMQPALAAPWQTSAPEGRRLAAKLREAQGPEAAA